VDTFPPLFYLFSLLRTQSQWAGRTIALGTFPQAEADEKCARAKALTRAWRSTMRPKPSREWVILELERLHVRVVSGRLVRKDGERDTSGESSDCDDDDELAEKKKKKSKKSKKKEGDSSGDADGLADSIGNYSIRNSINASLINAANSERGGPNLLNVLTWGGSDAFAQLTNSSLAMNLSGASAGNIRNDSLSRAANVDDTGFGGQPNRPYVGGASACAYEAARADYYRKQSQKKERGNGQSPRDSADSKNSGGIGVGDVSSGFDFHGSANVLNPGGGIPQLGLSVNQNQHYEMLKLHHMNLLNEIQETTQMMNLYQQQQLQQQKAAQSTESNMEQQLQQLAQRQQVEAIQQFPNSFSFPQAPGNMLGVGVGLGSGLGSVSGSGSSSTIPSLLLQQLSQFGGTFPDAAGGNRMPRRLSLEHTEELFSNDLQREIEMQERRLQRMKEELARKRDREDPEKSKSKRVKAEDA